MDERGQREAAEGHRHRSIDAHALMAGAAGLALLLVAGSSSSAAVVAVGATGGLGASTLAVGARLVRRRASRDAPHRTPERMADDLLRAEERARLAFAASVHDGPLQLLLAARHRLEDVEDPRAAEAGELVQRACRELRDLQSAVEPDGSGLDARARLSDWCRLLAGEGRFDWDVRVDDEVDVVPSLALAAGRELITNAVKHAGPRRLDVRVDRDDADVRVVVADDGQGHGGADDGFGLRTLRMRLAGAGGTLELGEGPGGGTVARAWVPLPVATSLPSAPPAALAVCR